MDHLGPSSGAFFSQNSPGSARPGTSSPMHGGGGAYSPMHGGGWPGSSSPMHGGGVPHYPQNLQPGQSGPAGSSFLNLFGDSELSLQEIADRAHQLQQKIDENCEQEKQNLRASAETKHLEIERHAAELARHAASSIEAYKAAQLQTAERQKSYQQAVVKQQAEQARRLIDQQAAQAIQAVESRERHVDLQRQQQDLMQRSPPAPYLGGPPPAGMPPVASMAGPGYPMGMPLPSGMPGMYSSIPAPLPLLPITGGMPSFNGTPGAFRSGRTPGRTPVF